MPIPSIPLIIVSILKQLLYLHFTRIIMNKEIWIRRAQHSDEERIMELLRQVNDVHADGRPDLFRHGCTKYTRTELSAILDNELTPVFVAVDDADEVVGYCFCVVQDYSGSNNLMPVKTLYIDDLCIDRSFRGRHIGQRLYAFVKNYAKNEGFYNLTLNVWTCNPGAILFYESLGMHSMKTGMEEIL